MFLSKKIASFCSDFKAMPIPKVVIDKAIEAIVDGTGVGIAAKNYNFSNIIIKTLREFSESGDISIFGQKIKLSLRDSILANSALIHGLDFDDTHVASVTHCTASLWPTCYALGVTKEKSGLDTLRAYILGYEIAARLGMLGDGELQAKGYHPTGIIGIFGCTVSACYLKDCRVDETENAIGIALSLASGNMQFIDEGAWNKRLHPGWAGQGGVLAANLAKNGFIGPKLAFEGKFGLFRTIMGRDKKNIEKVFSGLGSDWKILENAIKPYPACHFNHAFADCALKLSKEKNFSVNNIKKIIAYIHPDQVSLVCDPLEKKQVPQNQYEAQFSVPYIVASILVNGKFSLAHLRPEALNDQNVIEISKKVTYERTFDSEYPNYFSGWLKILDKNGRSFEKKIRYNRGTIKNPITTRFIMEKYFDNSEDIIGQSRAQEIYQEIKQLPKCPNRSTLNELFFVS